MTISLHSVQRAGSGKPPICLLYGKPGIGKTTFAASAPSPIFIQTEDGLVNPALAETPTFGVMSSYDDVMQAIGVVAENSAERDWRTLVIDSVDRLNPLMTQFVCQQNGWNNLEDGQYGRGKVALVDEWRQFMTMLIELRNYSNMSIIMLGHHRAVRVTPPDSEPFIQYSPTLDDAVSRILIGDSDMVLFATHPITTSSTNVGFKKTVTRAAIDKARVYTQERGSHIAKNRYSMPEFMPFDWPIVAQYVPQWATSQQPARLAEFIAQQPASAAPYEEPAEETAQAVH